VKSPKKEKKNAHKSLFTECQKPVPRAVRFWYCRC